MFNFSDQNKQTTSNNSESLLNLPNKQKKISSLSGNWTPVSRVTGGDTYHYTNKDSYRYVWKLYKCLHMAAEFGIPLRIPTTIPLTKAADFA